MAGSDNEKVTEREKKGGKENDNKLSYLLNILLSGLSHGCRRLVSGSLHNPWNQRRFEVCTLHSILYSS